MKILIVEHNENIRALWTIFIEGPFENIKITEAVSGNVAINILKNDSQWNCIIADNEMPGESVNDLGNYLSANKLNIPLILIPPLNIQQLRMKLEPLYLNWLQQNGLESNKQSGDFCKCRLDQLHKMDILPTDLYMRLSDEKFVRVMYKGDVFEHQDLERYSIKNIQSLYMKKNDFFSLMDKMQNDLHKINKLLSGLNNDIIEIPVTAHDLVREFYQKFGINETVQDIIKESVQLTLKSVVARPSLHELFKKLKNKEGHYISNHSILLAHVSCALAIQMKWTPPGTNAKLVMAAFMHDMTLEDMSLEQVLKKNEMMKSNLSELYQNSSLLKYHNHPLACADLLKDVDTAISETSVIIAQHHERPDGTGFPHKLNSFSIHPLSAIVIVAHELVDNYLKEFENPDVIAYINNLPDAYQHGSFRPVLRALTEMAIRMKF